MGVERGYRTCSGSSARRPGSQWNLGRSDSKTQIFNHYIWPQAKSSLHVSSQLGKFQSFQRSEDHQHPRFFPPFVFSHQCPVGEKGGVLPTLSQGRTVPLPLIIPIWCGSKLFPHHWTCFDPPPSCLASWPGCSRGLKKRHAPGKETQCASLSPSFPSTLKSDMPFK